MGIAAGLTLASSLVGAVGNYQSAQYAADQSKRAAKVGEIQADQVNTAYREDFNATVANIKSIRSSVGVGANSPTEMAYIDEQRETSNRDRKIEVGNKLMQADQDRADAAFRRSSAGWALFGDVMGGLTKAVSL